MSWPLFSEPLSLSPDFLSCTLYLKAGCLTTTTPLLGRQLGVMRQGREEGGGADMGVVMVMTFLLLSFSFSPNLPPTSH